MGDRLVAVLVMFVCLKQVLGGFTRDAREIVARREANLTGELAKFTFRGR